MMTETAPKQGSLSRRLLLLGAAGGLAGLTFAAFSARGRGSTVTPEMYASRFTGALKEIKSHPELLESISVALGSAVLLDSTHHRLTPVGGLFVSQDLNRKIMAGVTPIVKTKTGDSSTIRTEPFTRFGFGPQTDPRFPGAQLYYGDKDPVAGALLSVDSGRGIMVNVDLTTANPNNPYSSGGLQPIEGGFGLATSVAEEIYKTIK